MPSCAHFFEPNWKLCGKEHPRPNGLGGLCLKQRRVEGVYVPVSLYGEVRSAAPSAQGEARDADLPRCFVKFFDREFLRDNFSDQFERAIDQRGVDSLLERERLRLLAEIEEGRRRRARTILPLLDSGIAAGGQQLFAVYPLMDGARRFDRLLHEHGEDDRYRIAAVRALLDVLEELEEMGVVHAGLCEKEIFFPDAEGSQLGAPRLLAFTPAVGDGLEGLLDLVDREEGPEKMLTPLSRSLPALFLARVLGRPEARRVSDPALLHLAHSDFSRRFPMWYRRLSSSCALEDPLLVRSPCAGEGQPGEPSAVDAPSPRASSPMPAPLPLDTALESEVGAPIVPRGRRLDAWRLRFEEELAREGFGEGGAFSPSAADDRRAFMHLLLRSLRGRIEDVVHSLGSGPERAQVDFDLQLERYLTGRGASYSMLSAFVPLLLSGLRLGSAPPSLARLRELFSSATAHLAAQEVDELAAGDEARLREGLEALDLRHAELGLQEAREVVGGLRALLDLPSEVARVHVRGRLRRYRVLYNPPSGLRFGKSWIYFSLAREAFVSRGQSAIEPLPDEGALSADRTLHPFCIHKTSDRMVFEIEGFYGERFLYVAGSPRSEGPVFRLGMREGRFEFDFFGERDSFVPVVELRRDGARGDSVRVHPAARATDCTLDGAALTSFDIDRWIPVEGRSERQGSPLFEIPMWDPANSKNGRLEP